MKKSKYFKMNRSAKELEFGILGFYYFIYLCFTHVSDFMMFFRRFIKVRQFLICSYCFDRDVILFNSKICVCECLIGTNYL